MKLKSLGEEEVVSHYEGLVDGGIVNIGCSNCRAGLMQVWRTRPHEPETWRLKALCPFCGDASFVTEVQGGFHVSGFAVAKPDEPDEDALVSTVIESNDIESDLIVFVTKKANENAKPIRLASR